jgi:hypothetical protein
MNTQEFFTNLTQQGVQFWADNDKLNIRSPKGVITPELHTELITRKEELLTLLNEIDVFTRNTYVSLNQGLSLQTIGRLIGCFDQQSYKECESLIIDPKAMAHKLTVTFKPLPNGYKNEAIIKFREDLEMKLRSYGVTIVPWEQAIVPFYYEIILPMFKWKKTIKTRVVRSEVNAVIDVERDYASVNKLGICIAENIYQMYCFFLSKYQQMSIPRIAKLSSWAVDHVAKYIEDPTNTQVIMLTNIDEELSNFNLPYQSKIKIGLNTLTRTFSQIVIGVSNEKVSILNMNLSDAVYSKDETESFVLNSLIPKIYVPILPLLLNRFELGGYKPNQSIYAQNLVEVAHKLAQTGLFPSGAKLSEVVKRKSHQDIVNIIVNGRTGVSYGFVAYAEAPQYIGKPEITEQEWNSLYPVEKFSVDEVRQNDMGRRYVKTIIGSEYRFKQIPDIWIVSSRSGCNKTNLSLESDIIRIGLTSKLFLQIPEGIDHKITDIKPSYDIYVMLAITLAAALYTPELIRNGAPIIHFHGYPAFEWFKPNEYCVGVNNPSVPCGTCESGVFNFMGISSLAEQQVKNIDLVSLIEPDHGTNVIANDWEYLVERLQTGCKEGQIELGGKHFAALKEKLGEKTLQDTNK